MTTLADIVDALERAYPPGLAESWDAVGLVCGVRDSPVDKVLVCVDPTAETVAEAVDGGAQLIVAHHPLLLRGVHGVAADDPKGSLVHQLIRAGIGLFCAHTNADSAAPGVSDALAAALGVEVTGVLSPHENGHTGLGRLGRLAQPMSLAEFVGHVATSLPATAAGVRATGDPARTIRTVAVSGGAGDSFLAVAQKHGVDAYVTADLRHHPASEHAATPDAPALVDVAHWASEWPWCAQAADVIRSMAGGSVDVHVSTVRTDPWTVHNSTQEATGEG
jgi:dinuclear metal center YbgI/SA1388 family protein